MVALARCSATASGGSSPPAVPAAHGHGSGHVAEAHGHDHHHEPFEVPDYRLFNVDGIPQLDDLRNKLAAEGLRDYWIRNIAWQYQMPQMDTPAKRIWYVFGKHGWKGALFFLGLTLLLDEVFGWDHRSPTAYSWIPELQPHSHAHGDAHGGDSSHSH